MLNCQNNGQLDLNNQIEKMAEGTYEYECMRAELLGTDPPDYEEFMKRKEEQEADVDEQFDTENLKEVDLGDESMKRVSGGLDELNSILQVTQKKINRFKASCGSLTNLLKIKIGHGSSSDSLTSSGNEANETKESGQSTPTRSNGVTPNGNCAADSRKTDLAKALDNHVDKLDIMVEKAERAQYSMAHQNKQMKKFLN